MLTLLDGDRGQHWQRRTGIVQLGEVADDEDLRMLGDFERGCDRNAAERRRLLYHHRRHGHGAYAGGPDHGFGVDALAIVEHERAIEHVAYETVSHQAHTFALERRRRLVAEAWRECSQDLVRALDKHQLHVPEVAEREVP